MDERRYEHLAAAELAKGAGKPTGARVTSIPTESPLLAAAVRVATAARIPVVTDHRAVPDHVGVSSERVIRECLGVGVRPVSLTGAWWRADHGPLVGFITEKGGARRPVALLPTSQGRYDVVDPITGHRSRVNLEVARTIDPEALMLYRSFPAKPVGRGDFIRFVLASIRARDGVILVFMALATGLLGLLFPLGSELLFDTIIPLGEEGYILYLVLVLAAGSIAALVFEVLFAYALLRIEGWVSTALQVALWERMLRLPVRFFRQVFPGGYGKHTTRITYASSQFFHVVVATVLGSLFGLFNFFLLFTYSVKLALLGLGLVLLLAVVVSWLSYKRLHYQRDVIIVSPVVSVLQQLARGITRFRASATESRALYFWSRYFGFEMEREYRSAQCQNATTALSVAFPALTSLVLYTAYLTEMETLSIGRFLAFIAAFNLFQSATLKLATTAVGAMTMVVQFETVVPTLASPTETNEKTLPAPTLSGALEVSHVTFRYEPDTPVVLDDLSLYTRPGEWISVVGPSGSGKSTLLRLLLGFEQPQSGAIYYDGADLRRLRAHDVRRQMGVVLESDSLFAGSVLANILGESGRSEEDAWDVLRVLRIDEEIRKFPRGIHTTLAPDAPELASGLKDRLVVARALVKRPRLFVIDGAFSRLDEPTRTAVVEYLKALGATGIVLTHEVRDVEFVDRIYLLDEGGLVATGTYSELMAQTPLFASLAG